MECNLCKIFVGNVPFNCTQSEFYECFEKIIGFMNAEIICSSDTNMSRGFGFITFDTYENAKNILNVSNIMLKDRVLRFSEYIMNNNVKHESINTINLNKNLIVVKNINPNITRDDLYKMFSSYDTLGKYFIVSDRNTGNYKSYAIVEILNDSVYEFLINQKEIMYDSNIYEICKWKMPIKICRSDKKNINTNTNKIFMTY